MVLWFIQIIILVIPFPVGIINVKLIKNFSILYS